MKALKLITQLTTLTAIITLLRENKRIRDQLTELTQKYWEGNMQIALYSDENTKLNKLTERDKPMKPEYEGDGYDDKGELIYDTAYCPRCKKAYEVGYEDGHPYCDNCGQRLDWGREE